MGRYDEADANRIIVIIPLLRIPIGTEVQTYTYLFMIT